MVPIQMQLTLYLPALANRHAMVSIYGFAVGRTTSRLQYGEKFITRSSTAEKSDLEHCTHLRQFIRWLLLGYFFLNSPQHVISIWFCWFGNKNDRKYSCVSYAQIAEINFLLNDFLLATERLLTTHSKFFRNLLCIKTHHVISFSDCLHGAMCYSSNCSNII
jgi:hypothetical protein